MGRVCLVSCGKQKVDGPVAAADLYVSDGFRKARAYAEANADRWFILSAEHCVLAPTDLCSRYEKTLIDMTAPRRKAWADRVVRQLLKRLQPGDEVTFLAGKSYRSLLIPELEARGFSVRVPMEGLSQGLQKKWLMDEHAQHVERFYSLLGDLSRKLNGPRILGECCGRDAWPERGVYFFYEPGEMRRANTSRPRVVRVGTHALGDGHGSSLWSRLRAHRGGKDGVGNHSGSIFRKHVGAATINRDKLRHPTWGRRSVTAAEKRLTLDLERRVSEYLAATSVLWLEVDDAPGRKSDRAIIETNAIALLSRHGDFTDGPSAAWLGRYSSSEKVRGSGLWNVDDVGTDYKSTFLDTMERRIRRVRPV